MKKLNKYIIFFKKFIMIFYEKINFNVYSLIWYALYFEFKTYVIFSAKV